MLGFENLDESLSFIKTYKPELLTPLYSDLNRLSVELESLCYLLLDEQKKQWLTADDTSLEAFYDHALVLKDLYLELLEHCPSDFVQEGYQETAIQELHQKTIIQEAHSETTMQYERPVSGLNGVELSFDDDWARCKVVCCFFRNEWLPVSSFTDVLIQLSSVLYKEYGSKLFKTYNSTYRKKNSPFFSTSSYEVAKSKRIPNTRFFASTAGQSSIQKKVIQNLLDLTDYTVADLKIYVKS